MELLPMVAAKKILINGQEELSIALMLPDHTQKRMM